MKRIYVAGRYSADNVMEVLGNIRRGIEVSRELLMRGYAPFCPWMDFLYVLTADYPDLDWRDETEMLAKASEAVGAGRIYIEDSPNGTPTIYSPMEYINRDEAERMIAEVMKLHGYNDIVCKWKRTKIV